MNLQWSWCFPWAMAEWPSLSPSLPPFQPPSLLPFLAFISVPLRSARCYAIVELRV